jgi:hypothetical protein
MFEYFPHNYGKCVADRLGGRGEPSVPGYAEHVNWVFGKESIEETLQAGGWRSGALRRRQRPPHR